MPDGKIHDKWRQESIGGFQSGGGSENHHLCFLQPEQRRLSRFPWWDGSPSANSWWVSLCSGSTRLLNPKCLAWGFWCHPLINQIDVVWIEIPLLCHILKSRLKLGMNLLLLGIYCTAQNRWIRIPFDPNQGGLLRWLQVLLFGPWHTFCLESWSKLSFRHWFQQPTPPPPPSRSWALDEHCHRGPHWLSPRPSLRDDFRCALSTASQPAHLTSILCSNKTAFWNVMRHAQTQSCDYASQNKKQDQTVMFMWVFPVFLHNWDLGSVVYIHIHTCGQPQAHFYMFLFNCCAQKKKNRRFLSFCLGGIGR